MHTVVLAGGPVLTRAAMKAVIESGRAISVVGQAADGVRFCELLGAGTEPDVILLDRTLQGRDISAFTDVVGAASAVAPTIVFGVPNAQESDACLRAGATGVLAADITATQLVAALETVLRGGLVVVLGTAPVVLAHHRRTAGPETAPELSRREREILTMVAGGQENSSIAQALGISPLTVKTHIANMFAKTGVRQRGHLIAFAYESGVVVPGGTPVSLLADRLSVAS
ncbi:LuxR C-terminal-related transcriptional regulator [Streptomyces sp. NPDC088746]|uniref:LuxR C-terminal-related transcriptional regulator n=1 Tax=Streptomyces sp. NPDC088746 TaxID=3365885 RepID=UPI00381BB696